MIEYPYEEGSAAGYSGTVSQRIVLSTLFFSLLLFRSLFLQGSYKFRVRPGVELIFFRRLFKVFFTCS